MVPVYSQMIRGYFFLFINMFLTFSIFLKALEKSLTSFKAVVSNFKKQLSEHTETSLLTMSDVYSSMITLYKDTGLAKVTLHNAQHILLANMGIYCDHPQSLSFVDLTLQHPWK